MERRYRIYPGWIVVFASLVSFLVFGVFYSYGIFFNNLVAEFGWSKAVAASVGSIALPIFSSFGLVMGWFSDRYGSRRVMGVSTILFTLGYVSLSRAEALWHFYILYSLAAVGWGAMATVPPAAIARWFVKKRGTAFGIALTGGGIGGAIMPTLTHFLIEAYGWRASFAIIGAVFGVVLAISSRLLYHRPEDLGLKAYGAHDEGNVGEVVTFTLAEVLKTPAFWQLFTAFSLAHASLMGVMVHLAPYAVSQGVPAWAAAAAVSLVSGASIIGRICVGYLSDRIGGTNALAVSLGIAALLIVPVILAPSIGTLFLSAAAYGFFYGGWLSSVMESTRTFFGGFSYGAIWSAINAGGGVEAFLARSLPATLWM